MVVSDLATSQYIDAPLPVIHPLVYSSSRFLRFSLVSSFPPFDTPLEGGGYEGGESPWGVWWCTPMGVEGAMGLGKVFAFNEEGIVWESRFLIPLISPHSTPISLPHDSLFPHFLFPESSFFPSHYTLFLTPRHPLALIFPHFHAI